MRATEFIRGLLDLIDTIDSQQDQVVAVEPVAVNIEAPSDDINHFKQIVDFLTSGEQQGYANQPNEVVADLDAVTTAAGGGVNGPKDIDDLRGDSVRIYGSN
jgi:hypothetical protein